MSINLDTLSQATLTANTLANLILVSPQKEIGIKPTQQGKMSLNVPSLLFHIKGEEQANLRSDITDHFVEDNTAINDHITLRPEIISVQGFIGELNNVTPELLVPLRIAADKLQVISAFTPGFSITALRAYNLAEQLYRVTENVKASGVASWNSLSNSRFGTTTGQLNEISSTGLVTDNGNQTKQQKAFQQLYGYWHNRTLFRVQTPWAIFNNMAIEDLVAIQDEETEMVTDFKVQFKIMRFASTELSSVLSTQGRFANQASKEVNLGVGSTSPSKPFMSVVPK